VAAQLTATEEHRGFSRTAVTGSDGSYIIDLLFQGSYTLTCELQDFKKHVRSKIPLLDGQEMSLDVTLELGEVSSTVTVSEAVPVVISETAELAATAGTRQVMNYTLSGASGFLYGMSLPGGAYSATVYNSRVGGSISTQTGVRIA